MAAAQYPQESYLNVKLHPGSLLAHKREAAFKNSLKQQLNFLKSTGRYDCFKLQWKKTYEEPPTVWPIGTWLCDETVWDSDVGKWLEGACYFLHTDYDEEVDTAVQELTGMVASAQQEDGYLNLHYTVVERDPEHRFSNFRDMCELYNAGHLLEGALAHQHYYKNDLLLNPLLKYIDLMLAKIGPDEHQLHAYPGHPEIELALLRLYNRTKDPRHFALARYFVTERGNAQGKEGMHFYDWEAAQRGDDPHRRPYYYPERTPSNWYYSASCPLVDMNSVEGHSVRPTYLLTAVADIVRMDESGVSPIKQEEITQKFKESIVRLWRDMVGTKMYVTGGIGAIAQYEGFGLPYFLPQGTDEGGCYAETCAGIGIMMMVERVLQYDLDGSFTDIMELVLYNAVLTAMSTNGLKYTYVNQLASSDKNPSERSEWFKCCCCPPNIMRTLAIIGGYITSQPTTSDGSTHIAVHLYISSTLDFETDDQHEKSQLSQSSRWPWDGVIQFELRTKSQNVSISVRIPSWAKEWSLDPPLPSSTSPVKGYLTLPSSYLSQYPRFTLNIPLEKTVRYVAPHPFSTQGDVLTLSRGPVVYCVEDYDNPGAAKDGTHFKTLQIDPDAPVTASANIDEATGEEYVALTVGNKGASVLPLEKLNVLAYPGIDETALKKVANEESGVLESLTWVPYYFRSNRPGKGIMRTGIRRWLR